MTREQALQKAKELHAAYRKAVMNELFHKGPKVNDDDFCHRHGWFVVGEFSFNDQDITGRPYDMHQGGWAWV